MSQITRESENAIVILDGDLLASGGERIRGELLDLIQDGVRQITIDFDAVSLVDSNGIGTLIAAHNQLKSGQGSLKLTNVSPDIAKMFKIMRLNRHFDIAQREVA